MVAISEMVSRLLSHFWTGADTASARQAQIEDWIADLIEFGPAIVNEACTQWRRQPGGRRPTPGDIRVRCIEAQRDVAEHRLAIENKSATWAPWLYEIWGPASTGMAKREAAKREIDLSLRKAEDWRASEDGKAAARGFKSLGAAAMGVTAKEFTPSAERLAADRRALGIDPDPAGASE